MRWVVPEERLKSVTFPSAPTRTVTEFGTVWPAVKFSFDALGRAVPEGYAVMKPKDCGWVMVMLKTTADTLAGTPDAPPT